MIDEHFMRDWNTSHDAFSAGVTRMLSKASRNGDAPVSDSGTDLRHAHANRIGGAIVAGLLAGVLVATAAIMIEPVTPEVNAAAQTASHLATYQ